MYGCWYKWATFLTFLRYRYCVMSVVNLFHPHYQLVRMKKLSLMGKLTVVSFLRE